MLLNILFVTLSPIEINGSAMIRNNALINGLVENGNNVEILTIPTQNHSSFVDNTLIWSDDLKITTLKPNQAYKSLVKKSDNFFGKLKRTILPLIRKIYHSFSLFDNSIYIAKKVNKKVLNRNYYDLIISSSDPKSSHYAVKQLINSGLKYEKWIQYWGDPLAIDITNKSIHPKFYIKNVEKSLLKPADKIVYVSPLTYAAQIKLYSQLKDKMSFMPIPYTKKKFYQLRDLTNRKPSLGYFGDYKSSVRNIKKLYNVCRDEDFNLIIAGNTDLNLKETNSIRILPRVSQKRLMDLETNVDILVCILNKRGTQIPGKIYHYAATNKPILVILDGEEKEEIRKYLEGFNRFVLCNNDEVSIKQTLTAIKNSNIRYEPSPYFESKYIANSLIELIK